MVIIESVLGNLDDERWAAIAARVRVDELRLSQWDAQKNRFRKVSESGAELAVSLSRNAFLRDGDVLAWDEVAGILTVARVLLREVLVIDLSELAATEPSELVRTCVELGHALGNQHWPAVVKDHRVFVPLTVDRKVMSSVMRTHAFKGITWDFAPGSFAVPYLLPHEARRLFGAAEQQSHAHHALGGDIGDGRADKAETARARDHGPSHDYAHGHGHDHHH